MLWRVGRFGASPVKAEGWRGFDWKGSSCEEAQPVPAVGLALADKVSGKRVAAVSFKMSHAGGDECKPAEEEIATRCNNRSFTLANDRLDALGGALKIIAGDWNYKDACKPAEAWEPTCVYRRALGALGGACLGKSNLAFVDPVYAALEKATPSETFQAIRDENWTFLGVGRARIDFLLARTGVQGSTAQPPAPVAASHAAAITYEAADAASEALAPEQNVAFVCTGDGPDEGSTPCDSLKDHEGFYSDHRGQYARFHYP